MESFEFIMLMVTWENVLKQFSSVVSKVLQLSLNNLYRACDLLKEVVVLI